MGRIQTRLGVALVSVFSAKILLLTSSICCLLDSTEQRYCCILSKDATRRLGRELNHQQGDHGRRKSDAPNHSATLPTKQKFGRQIKVAQLDSNKNWNKCKRIKF